MLYEAYVKKVTRWVHKRDAVLKYKAPIIIAACVIFAAVAGFIATRGMLIGGLECPSEVSYGSGAPMNAKALFGKPYYEYAEQGSNAWSTELPSGVGRFKVRAVSDRSFGMKSYSDEFAFVITPARVTVVAAGDQITYGSMPEASSSLHYEDKIESAEFKMSSREIGSSRVSAIADTVKVVDKNGRDVSAAYVFETPEKTVEIIPRVITVRLHDAEKEYDGKALTCKTYDNFDDQLIDGHSGYVTLGGQQTEAGTSENTVLSFEVYDGRKRVTSNYDYVTVGGSLTVKPRKITVMTGSSQRQYNGQTLVNSTAVLSGGTLLRNHKILVAGNTEAFNVGTYDNVLDIKIVDRNNTSVDLTANYSISFDYGTLTVTSKPITIMPKMIVKEYDGVPLNVKEATLVGSALAEGDSIELTTTATLTEVGSSENSIIDYRITHGAIDVTGNYNVTCLDSSITITKRSIVVKPVDVEREYDATPLTCVMPELSAGSIAIGQTMILETSGSITTVGTCANHITSYVIMANGADVTHNYNVIIRSGRLTVTKRALTITAASTTKVYDATPLIDQSYSITDGSVANGQTLTVSVSGIQTDAGESANRITSWKITDAESQDVSKYYAVTLETGVLTVEPRPITIASADAKKMYDGTPLTASAHFVQEGTLVDGHRVIAVVIGEQINAGVGVNMFESIDIINDKTIRVTDNYDITVAEGELTVLPRKVSVVYTGSQQIYNGRPLLADSVTVTSTIKPLEGHTVAVATSSALAGAYGYKDCVAHIVTEDGSTSESANYDITIESGNVMTITRFSVMIKPENAEREYDGTPLTSNVAELVEPKRLPSGHYIELITDGSVTDVIYNGNDAMPIINRITSFTVRNENGDDVTDSFTVSTQPGTLLVTPRIITLKPKNEVKEYDGTPLMGNTPECAVGSIAEGQVAMITTQGKQTEIGSSDNVIVNHAIMTEDYRNVTVNYRITIEKGTLTVTQRKLVIAPADVEKMYDGTPLSATEAIIREGSLLPGHSFGANVEGSRIDAGTTASTVIPESVTVTNNGEDVSQIYNVILAEGAVTVTPRPITVVFESLFKIYDGVEFMSDKYIVISEIRPLEGHRISIQSESDEAGIYDATRYTIRVLDAETNDVTLNYDITHTDNITIEKRTVFLDLKPAQKAYDGEVLRVENIATSMGTSLVVGHVAHAITDAATPAIYAFGAEQNGFKVFIYDTRSDPGAEVLDPIDVTANYDIRLTSDPPLVIEHRGLTVTVSNTAREYDATAIFDASAFITEGVLANGHTFIHKNIGNVRVGVYSGLSVNDLRVLDAEGNDITRHYQIVFVGQQTFSVEILPRRITITAMDCTKQYDGTASIDATGRGFVSAETPLPSGHRLMFYGTESGLGVQTVSTANRKIISDLYGDVTDCFEIVISPESFELTTVLREITIRPTTVSRPYNGNTLYGSTKADVIAGSTLLEGHYITIVTEGSQTEIGDGIITIVSYVIRDAEGNDVTHFYNVTKVDGVARVLRVSLVLATSDASAAYTGNSLSARGVSVFIGKLLDGHVIYDAEAEYAEVTNVGTFSNTVQGVRIHNASGEDVTNMYNISYKFGTLTITST